ncbi:uncharacterized protein TrAtP1_000088 [Trichoderma atroviride]|uniref:uncharacterized protein n=1 Tax=Hypocrea atroviridis TaxID=63577 RepID=UPI00332E3006|nr:hypothetical protein TrAtP1_000088 [Trichoderma atroviride]
MARLSLRVLRWSAGVTNGITGPSLPFIFISETAERQHGPEGTRPLRWRAQRLSVCFGSSTQATTASRASEASHICCQVHQVDAAAWQRRAPTAVRLDASNPSP